MEEIEQLENGKLLFHSYDALKKYCDDVNNPLDKVVKMTIKEILKNDTSLSDYIIEVNNEMYDEHKHGDLVHIDTEIKEAYQEYNHTFNITFYRTKIKFLAIEKEKVLKLLKEKDTDNSLSAFLDKRIKEIAKE